MRIIETIPKYRRLASKLKKDLFKNGFSQGSYVPTEVDLAGRYRVNRFTIRKAMKHLEQEGVVSTIVAKRRRILASAGIGNTALPTLIGCTGYGSTHCHQFVNPVYQQLFHHLIRVFQEINVGVVPIYDGDRLQNLTDLAHAGMVRCLLTMGETGFLVPAQWDKPVVAIDCGYEPLVVNAISPDANTVVMTAMRYLAERGHRRAALVYVEPPGPYAFFDHLRLGYSRGFSRCGLSGTPAVIALTSKTLNNAELLERSLRRALAETPDVSALMLCSASISEQIMGALHKLEIGVPQTLSVLAIAGDDKIAERLSLTAFANDYPALAVAVRNQVLNLLEGRMRAIGHVFINSFQLVERTSVAPLRPRP